MQDEPKVAAVSNIRWAPGDTESLYDWNMQLNMDDKQIQTLEQVQQFVG